MKNLSEMTVEELVVELADATVANKEARAALLAVEDALLEKAPLPPGCTENDELLEGVAKEQAAGYNVEYHYKITRSIEPRKFELARDNLDPRVLVEAIKMKPSINLRFYRSLEDSDLDSYTLLSSALKVKQAKTAITLTRDI